MKGKAMIGAKELVYYVEPLTPPVAPEQVKPGTMVYLTAQQSDSSRTGKKPGEVVEVSRAIVDRNSSVLVDKDGWYVTGHMMNRPQLCGGHRLAFVKPDLAALVTEGSRNREMTQITGSVQGWSDGKERTTPYGLWPMTVPAAPWAVELWPHARDTEPMVQAKVALAKEQWEQAQKKLRIIREGASRNWLPELEKVRAKGHDFPRPTFHLNVIGLALVRVGAPTKAAMAKVQSKLESNGSKITIDAVQGRPAFVSTPVEHLIPLNISDTELAKLTPGIIEAHIREKMQDYDLRYLPEQQYPILAGFKR